MQSGYEARIYYDFTGGRVSKNVKEAMEAYLESLQKHAEPVPILRFKNKL